MSLLSLFRKKQPAILTDRQIACLEKNLRSCLAKKPFELAYTTLAKTMEEIVESFRVDILKAGEDIEKLFESLCQEINYDEIVPEGTIYFRRCSGGRLYVIQQKPSRRTVYACMNFNFGKLNYANEQSWGYKLSLPYVVFAILVSGSGIAMRVGFRNEAVQSINDSLYYPSLPNISAHLNVCLGDFVTVSDKTPAQNAEKAITSFWSSEFTCLQHTAFPKDPRLVDLATWEAVSQKDPLFATSVDWPQSPFTIRSLFNTDLRSGNTVFDSEIANKLHTLYNKATELVVRGV